MMFAERSSTSSVTLEAASSTSNNVRSSPPVMFTNRPFADFGVGVGKMRVDKRGRKERVKANRSKGGGVSLSGVILVTKN